ncbi:hypothetical protein [Rossellomorea sp. KS-H15a]|uniref:hypothetical protein n=1 Tax=Rossellomorea sp. KS-H15a TaxID=2963940 RepID=UPI0020C6BD05|nr:hypothetical protein [Rossellomorea sp. KS-H15a]UTE77371.1 hypothetical protein M1J35_00555 [Rossellomorea sp. KS-H15a]
MIVEVIFPDSVLTDVCRLFHPFSPSIPHRRHLHIHHTIVPVSQQKKKFPINLRLISAVVAFLLIYPGWVTDIIGFAVFVFVLFWNYQGKGKPMNMEINIPN